MLILLEKAFVYGCLGILIEVFFTGIGSLLRKHWDAKSQTYLWMGPIYGFTALFLEVVSEAISWPFYLKALIYVPIIYATEALSGWVIKQIIGKIPWDYGMGRWTPMGLINLKYAPYWFALALAFDPITRFLTKILQAVALVIG